MPGFDSTSGGGAVSCLSVMGPSQWRLCAEKYPKWYLRQMPQDLKGVEPSHPEGNGSNYVFQRVETMFTLQ